MRESNLNLGVIALSRPDVGVSIVFPGWWYRLMRIWPVMQEQRNNLAMRVTLVPVANMSKAFYAHFDVNVALSQYIPVTYSVDFRCLDSKVFRLVCSHIQNIDMLTYQTSKCSFRFYQRHSFALDQFRNIFHGCFV